jgi:hypothetical protein
VHKKDSAALKSSVSSAKRVCGDYKGMSDALDMKQTDISLRRLTNPGSRNGAIRKAGIALAIAPEPITTAAGLVMIAGSYAMKSREPANLADMVKQTRKTLSDLSSLSLESLSFSF